MAPYGGCRLDCADRKGAYCDLGTGKCEDCMDICHPSRDTIGECLEQFTCHEYWPTSPSVNLESTVSPSANSTDGQLDVTLMSVTIIGAFVVILLFCVVIALWQKGKLQGLCKRRCPFQTKLSVQLSAEEQIKEQQQKLNAEYTGNFAGADSAPEVNLYTPTIPS